MDEGFESNCVVIYVKCLFMYQLDLSTNRFAKGIV